MLKQITRSSQQALWLTIVAAMLSTGAVATRSDQLFINGEIMTPSGWVEALAVRDGVIVAVGSQKDALAAKTENSQVVDLEGRTVLPGLYDMHVHAFFAGRQKRACNFPGKATAAVIVDTVKACVAATRPGDWITGGSWVGASFAPGEQHKRLLDAVAPDNPVVLNDESLHSVWANSKALEIAGINRDTPDPDGGRIDRDNGGEPTGVLREAAADTVSALLPKPDLATQVADIKAATDEMLSYGIVAFTDASIRKGYVEGMSEFARSGGLKQYARGCIVWGPGSSDSEDLIPRRQHYSGGRLKLDCIKLFLDGVPIESRTAAMLEPYLSTGSDDHPHGSTEERGMLMIPQQKLNRAVAEFDRQGLEIKFHAAGDASVRAAIDAIEHARAVNGSGGPRHHVGHNTFIDPADLPRFQTVGFAWEFSPYIWYPTPITAVDILAAVGPRRMERLWPIKDALDTGALVTAGSDWPVVPSVNPWLGIETLVSRQLPGTRGAPIGAGQRITMQQALEVFTRNGAAMMGRLDRGGTIEVGKLADLIVLDRNPTKIDLGEVHQTRVLKTFIAGEEVYSAPVAGQ